MNEKILKRKIIRDLKIITHWIETSSFDYTPKDLSSLLDEVKEDYKNYLQEK